MQQKLEATEAGAGQSELAAAGLEREIARADRGAGGEDARAARCGAGVGELGAALRQMESETARIERRLQEWRWRASATAMRADAEAGADCAAAAGGRGVRGGARRIGSAGWRSCSEQLDGLRAQREELQQAAAEASAALAGLEERRRNAEANFDQTNRLYEAQTQRDRADRAADCDGSAAEKLRREQETAALAAQHEPAGRDAGDGAGRRRTPDRSGERAARAMAELDAKLRTLRHETEALREQRAGLTARAAKLASDIEHIEATCLNDLGAEAAALREDAAIVRIEGEALAARKRRRAR